MEDETIYGMHIYSSDTVPRNDIYIVKDKFIVQGIIKDCSANLSETVQREESNRLLHEYARIRREYFAKRALAGAAVAAAIRKGVLVRQFCSICGRDKAHAHHEDYDKPLEVVWLCRKHHHARHVEINREYGGFKARLIAIAK